MKLAKLLPLIVCLPLISCEKKEGKENQSSSQNSVEKSTAVHHTVIEDRKVPESTTLATEVSNPKVFMDELRGLLSEIDPAKKSYRNDFEKIWHETLDGKFNRLLKDIPAEVQSGKKMPESVTAILERKGTVYDFPYAQDVGETKAAYWTTWLAALDNNYGSRVFPKLLQKRAESLPPTEEDLLMLYTFLGSSGELFSGKKSIKEDWVELAKSSNAIYRYIALQAAIRSAPANAEGISEESDEFNIKSNFGTLDFLGNYKNETDPIILKEVIRITKTSATLGTEQLLDELSRNPTIKETPELLNDLKDVQENLLNGN